MVTAIYCGKEVIAMSKPLYKPGEDNRPAGKYKEVGPRGGEVHKPRNVVIDPGDRLPPTQQAGHKWEKK
jgi:hypothetical protein